MRPPLSTGTGTIGYGAFLSERFVRHAKKPNSDAYLENVTQDGKDGVSMQRTRGLGGVLERIFFHHFALRTWGRMSSRTFPNDQLIVLDPIFSILS